MEEPSSNMNNLVSAVTNLEFEPQRDNSSMGHGAKSIYMIKKQQLDGRVVLGHINPITYQFVEVRKQDLSPEFTEL